MPVEESIFGTAYRRVRRAFNDQGIGGDRRSGGRQAGHEEELGDVPASKIGSELLFDVIRSAYECQSLIVTTNLPFENWTEVLSSERLT